MHRTGFSLVNGLFEGSQEGDIRVGKGTGESGRGRELKDLPPAINNAGDSDDQR